MARIILKQWCRDNGVGVVFDKNGEVDLSRSPELMEVAGQASIDGTCPAMCDEGCEVEPDGVCEHGAPSLLRVLSLI